LLDKTNARDLKVKFNDADCTEDLKITKAGLMKYITARKSLRAAAKDSTKALLSARACPIGLLIKIKSCYWIHLAFG
jgi:hypothetical protein